MPITRQAQKKMRSDRTRTRRNRKVGETLRQAVKNARKSPTAKTISRAFRELDRAAKKHVIHDNTAARLKSRLTKLLSGK